MLHSTDMPRIQHKNIHPNLENTQFSKEEKPDMVLSSFFLTIDISTEYEKSNVYNY